MCVIRLKTKSVYGLDKIYPDNDAAHYVLLMTGTKTLQRRDINALLMLGHVVILDNVKLSKY